ncbi:MAG: hypothetical protein COA69_02900 [Robiginitomaculum sp.]|nr:MAG: hypothetical protein COA69_02900 [Robiginitomaculum sp.]
MSKPKTLLLIHDASGYAIVADDYYENPQPANNDQIDDTGDGFAALRDNRMKFSVEHDQSITIQIDPKSLKGITFVKPGESISRDKYALWPHDALSIDNGRTRDGEPKDAPAVDNYKDLTCTDTSLTFEYVGINATNNGPGPNNDTSYYKYELSLLDQRYGYTVHIVIDPVIRNDGSLGGLP